MAWNVGDGKRVLVGQDLIVGCGSSYKLSLDLLQHLSSLQIYSSHIAHSSHLNVSGSHDWLDASDLSLTGVLAQEWCSYVMLLRSSGFSLKDEGDKPVWTQNKSSSSVLVKLAYEALVTD